MPTIYRRPGPGHYPFDQPGGCVTRAVGCSPSATPGPSLLETKGIVLIFARKTSPTRISVKAAASGGCRLPSEVDQHLPPPGAWWWKWSLGPHRRRLPQKKSKYFIFPQGKKTSCSPKGRRCPCQYFLPQGRSRSKKREAKKEKAPTSQKLPDFRENPRLPGKTRICPQNAHLPQSLMKGRRSPRL